MRILALVSPQFTSVSMVPDTLTYPYLAFAIGLLYTALTSYTRTQTMKDVKYVDLPIGARFKLYGNQDDWCIKYTTNLKFNHGNKRVTVYSHTLVLVEEES